MPSTAATGMHPPRNTYTPRSARIIDLAQPKYSATKLESSINPKVIWGNQEHLWPISDAALSSRVTGRVLNLSEPKRNFQGNDMVNRPQYVFGCGRHSVIWQVNPNAVATPTTRVLVLSQPKSKNTLSNAEEFAFGCGRSSPYWVKHLQKTNLPPRPRTEQLARHKIPHPNYLQPREVQTAIPVAAMSGKPSGRLEALSAPKTRRKGPYRDAMWTVAEGAMNTTPTPRQSELSRPKPLVDGFASAREVMWPVSFAARRAIATPRTEVLSRPVIRASMDHVQFDPDAFTVKELAKKAQCSQRIEELANPITRG